MLESLRIIAWGKPLGDGITNARYATVEGVAKVNNPGHPYVVANEYVAGEIGHFLGLPLPPSFVTRAADNTPLFLSVNFNPRGDDLPPVIPAMVARSHPDIAVGTLVYDMLIANSDRHNRNLVFDMTSAQIAIFDHSHALFGYLPAQGEQRLDNLLTHSHMGICAFPEPGGHDGNRHCLLDQVSDTRALMTWIDKVEQIPDYFLNRISADTVKLGVTQAEADTLRRYLNQRKASLRGIIAAQQSEFRKVTQWGII